MSGTSFGVGFTIGAALAPTVGASFSTLSQKIKASGSELAQLQAHSNKLSKADTLQAQSAQIKESMLALQQKRQSIAQNMTALRSQAQAGSYLAQAELRKARQEYSALGTELGTLRQAYGKAEKKAQDYAASLKGISTNHAEIAAAMLKTEKRLALQTSAQAHQDKSKELRGRMVESVVPALALAAPIHAAIQFESSMADVAKTLDGARDDAGRLTPKYYEIEAAVKELGRTVPLAHAEIASIFAAGGQQGMSDAAELKEFATLSAQTAVAFGMTADQAADKIGGLRSALGMSMPEARSLLDLMNQYANTGTSDEEGILEIVSRIGSLGDVAGLTAKPLTALAATLNGVKVAPEVAATALKNMMLTMVSGKSATKAQSAAFKELGFDVVKVSQQMQTDSTGAIISVLEAIKKLPEAEQAAMMTELFGKESIAAIAPLLTKLDDVKEKLIISADATAYSGAVQKEFENRNKTTAAALSLARNRLSEMGITLGAVVLPAIVSTLDAINPLVSGIANFAGQNKTLTTVLVGSVAGLVALRVVGLGAMFVYHGVAGAVSGVRAALVFLTAASARSTAAMVLHKAASIGMAAASKAAAAGQWVLNAALTANPIGIVIAAVAALVGGMVYLYKTCEPVRQVFDKVFSFIGAKFSWASDKLKAMWGGIKSMGKWFGIGEDEEDKAPTEQKHTIPVGLEPKVSPSISGIDAFAESSLSLPTSPAPQSGVAVSANFAFNLPAMPDADFAQRVIAGLNARKSEVEKLISGIVHDQMRVAYGA